MKFRIINTWNDVFSEESWREYKESLKEFSPSMEEMKFEKCSRYRIYIAIDTVQQLLKVCEIFKHDIVFGDKDNDGVFIIEDYDGYRE